MVERRVRHDGVEGSAGKVEPPDIAYASVEVRIARAGRRDHCFGDVHPDHGGTLLSQDRIEPGRDRLVEEIGLQEPAAGGGR